MQPHPALSKLLIHQTVDILFGEEEWRGALHAPFGTAQDKPSLTHSAILAASHFIESLTCNSQWEYKMNWTSIILRGSSLRTGGQRG
jgi:hypothetical protein